VDHVRAIPAESSLREPGPPPGGAEAALRRVAAAEAILEALEGRASADGPSAEDVPLLETVDKALQDALALAER
jgi:hypothetical protein